MIKLVQTKATRFCAEDVVQVTCHQTAQAERQVTQNQSDSTVQREEQFAVASYVSMYTHPRVRGQPRVKTKAMCNPSDGRLALALSWLAALVVNAARSCAKTGKR